MKTYTLKLKTTSTANYNLYDGTTLVSDSDLATLFGGAGEAYFAFDFNSLAPANTTSLTILNSQDTAVITNTGLSDIQENRNFKGVWNANATAFTTFGLLKGITMDEAQLGTLAGMIKNGAVKTLTTADYNWPVDNPTSVAMWQLVPGFYKAPQGIVLAYGSAETARTTQRDVTFIVSRVDDDISGHDFSLYLFLSSGYGGIFNPSLFAYKRSDGTNAIESYGEPIAYKTTVLTGRNVINVLTTNLTKNPLSAAQGKVLNGYIGDLNTLTTTAKTSTVAAINELVTKLAQAHTIKSTAPTTATVGILGQLYTDTTNMHTYQCTAIDTTDPQNPVYTWTQRW